jgi:hypothetical protein
MRKLEYIGTRMVLERDAPITMRDGATPRANTFCPPGDGLHAPVRHSIRQAGIFQVDWDRNEQKIPLNVFDWRPEYQKAGTALTHFILVSGPTLMSHSPMRPEPRPHCPPIAPAKEFSLAFAVEGTSMIDLHGKTAFAKRHRAAKIGTRVLARRPRTRATVDPDIRSGSTGFVPI